MLDRAAVKSDVEASDEPFGIRDKQKFMLTTLKEARVGLRQRNIDAVEKLFVLSLALPREQWPLGVARFLDQFKRPRGRTPSTRQDIERFSRDPNHLAAHLASLWVAKLRSTSESSKRCGPYKINLADGKKRTIVDASVELAVAEINSRYRFFLGRRKAHPEMVKELVRRGRTKHPASRFLW
jgi:hypothetical protein